MNPVQVRHVREALHQRFADLVDVSDLAGKPADEIQQAMRSRSLTALAVQIETGLSDEEAAKTVIDGRDDIGIDAVAVSSEGKAPHLWLVQTKWNERGAAGLKQDEALKFLRGLSKILNAEYTQFNARFQEMVEEVDAVMRNPRVQITIVVALMGETALHPDVSSVIDEECDKLNYAKPMLDYHVLGLKQFHRAILGEGAEPKVDVEVRLEGWNIHREPYEAYYGTMSIADIANWYEEHGRALFSKNIRDSLDLTDVNSGIVQTLTSSPQNFWYFNNGITVLCESVDKTPQFVTAPGGPGDFHLIGASVVNGAQTVAAAHRAVRQKSEFATSGQVLVRLISLENCPENFGTEVTEKTNTQNQVEVRDFATLDLDQHRLREDFTVALGKTYVIKRGEKEPNSENGCSIVEAIVALACINPNAELCARAKRDMNLLWERVTYRSIFGRHPNAYRVWRAVLFRRVVAAGLEDAGRELQGRAAAVAVYGDLLIPHIVYRMLGDVRIDDPETNWATVESEAKELTPRALDWLIHVIDAEFGSSSHVIAACKSSERSRTVVDRALQGLASGKPVPDLPAGYKASTAEAGGRRANAVSIIVDSGDLQDGAGLEFRPATKTERERLTAWLAADAARARATWVNDKNAPLIWAADGERYSPSGLVMAMVKSATGRRPRAVQGPSRWFVPGVGSLVEFADSIRAADQLDEA